jgi:oligopeptide transport system substrate-binding protein
LKRPLLAACVVALALAACEQQTPSGSALPSGSGTVAVDQVLRLAYIETGTLDPHLSSDATVSLLARGLTWFDEDLGTVPGLAESWDVSDDGLRVTFHLRAAEYSSGEPIAAADFIYFDADGEMKGFTCVTP